MVSVPARPVPLSILATLIASGLLAVPAPASPMGDVGLPGGASVVAVVRLGIAPLGPLLDPARDRMYVVNAGSDSVSVVDTDDYRVLDTIKVGDDVGAGVLDSRTHRLYVPMSEARRVAVIDTQANEVIETIRVGILPENLVIDRRHQQLFVPNALSGTVTVVDTRTNTVAATIDLAAAPGVISSDEPPLIGEAPVLDADRGLLYVAGSPVSVLEDGLVWVIDARTHEFIATIPVGRAPDGLALDGERGRLFVANHRSDTVSVVDTSANRVVATISVPVYGTIAYDSVAQKLYIPDRNDGLSVVSTRRNTVIDAIPTGKWPEPVVDAEARRLYVATYDGHVAVLDTRTYRQLGTIEFTGWPQAPVLDPDHGRMYVPDWAELEVFNSVFVVDTHYFRK
ncbi:MAG: YncE family protein [Actinomycetota bacterium]|nr:YncE family protein [Actinomycetota bacterium]